MTFVTITIPAAPPSKLFPNQQTKQGHWGVRARLRKEYREIAYYAACSATAGNRAPITGPVTIETHVGYSSRRKLPDLEATVYGCKSLMDGIVDAGVLEDDDQVVRLTATHEKLPKGADEFTRIIIRPVAERRAA